MLSKNGIIPPKEWIYDPNIKNEQLPPTNIRSRLLSYYRHINSKYTVAYYLKLNKLPIPNEWYDEEMKDVPT